LKLRFDSPAAPDFLFFPRCGFYGRRSEWIVSGSDDARVYFWNKRTGQLFNVLDGHEDVVNCVVASPIHPLVATSGIDNVVKLWEPVGRLSEKQKLKRNKLISDLVEEHRDPYASERPADVGSMCTQQ
jgi:WD40 repeat protein